MPDHRIKLRGAWDWLGLEAGAEVTRRVDLPVAWPMDGPPSFRLVRRFGRPPFDPSVEFVRLQLSEVPGLEKVELNGRGLIRGFEGTDLTIPLESNLLARNVLTLTIDLLKASRITPAWGSIALVIGLIDPLDGGQEDSKVDPR